jgi:hypothetical protein
VSVLDKPAGPLFREHTEPIRRMLHAALLEIFWKLIVAWVIGPGRHPITRLYSIAEPDGRRAHDTYHRFLRLGAWSLERLWRTLALLVVAALCPHGQLELAIDDTIFQKWGRKVEGPPTTGTRCGPRLWSWPSWPASASSAWHS